MAQDAAWESPQTCGATLGTDPPPSSRRKRGHRRGTLAALVDRATFDPGATQHVGPQRRRGSPLTM